MELFLTLTRPHTDISTGLSGIAANSGSPSRSYAPLLSSGTSTSIITGA
ncbi:MULTISPECIES: hypothetical protein [Agrobacterium]|uniref:Uncharacterized protein n=2 Tax=Agrobacterium tumefaciens complex TaxID=1183400 RepID=A0AAW8M0P2_AGRTU|nr:MULTISPECIES: hypothetical protein [Agrobacterium]MCP2137979.1 hypothetical protein [Rhizobium sp. SLBN-94]EPR23406.1 hypothetical protein L902_00260 [Agrobacterium radiobacter DSM 30147]MBB4320670.1 hypothetical protein [Agrobacterium radiobacter]MBB4337334.1 hypothetical protein [Agrobacterium radiobacter]MBB4409359.1 hypothetical protein [Agrobacterium radiobacter]